jgi:putative peptidoglycan lipid II flippase
VPQLAAGFAMFAPGLSGYGLVACLSRVLLAAGRTSAAAVIVGGGWLLVIVADVVMVALSPGSWVVALLAFGNTIGLTASGLALVVVVRRVRGPGALRGTLRVGLSGLAAAAAGAAAGTGIAAAIPDTGAAQEGLLALLAALFAVAAFGAVAWLLDGGDLRAALGRARGSVLR